MTIPLFVSLYMLHPFDQVAVSLGVTDKPLIRDIPDTAGVLEIGLFRIFHTPC